MCIHIALATVQSQSIQGAAPTIHVQNTNEIPECGQHTYIVCTVHTYIKRIDTALIVLWHLAIILYVITCSLYIHLVCMCSWLHRNTILCSIQCVVNVHVYGLPVPTTGMRRDRHWKQGLRLSRSCVESVGQRRRKWKRSRKGNRAGWWGPAVAVDRKILASLRPWMNWRQNGVQVHVHMSVYLL